MNSIDAILKYIHGSDDFVVTSHVNPDGDNIGSTLSIYYFLKQINKNVYYVMNDEMPLNMQFLMYRLYTSHFLNIKLVKVEIFILLGPPIKLPFSPVFLIGVFLIKNFIE